MSSTKRKLSKSSRRLEEFIDAWQGAIGERRMWTLPESFDPVIEQVFEAETLAEAHRLAMEAVDEVRRVNAVLADRMLKIAFGR